MQENLAQAAFNPFSDNAAPVFQSSSFDIQSPAPFPAESRPFPAGIGENPFAMAAAAVEPLPAASNHHAQGDLLDIFGGEPQVTSVPSQEEDIFDPLAQVNGRAQEVSSPPANISSIDQPQPTSHSATFSPFNEASQKQSDSQVSSVSRPKPATLSTGLLPPPPTKQSIKEKNKNSSVAGTLRFEL